MTSQCKLTRPFDMNLRFYSGPTAEYRFYAYTALAGIAAMGGKELVKKKQITLEDGRYLIYFSFDEKKEEKQDKEKTGCCGNSCCCGGKK